MSWVEVAKYSFSEIDTEMHVKSLVAKAREKLYSSCPGIEHVINFEANG